MFRNLHIHGQSAAAFARREDGSLSVFALVLFFLMIAMAGIAVDVMRFETTRTALSNTLDRCTLMAAAMDQRLDPESVVEDCVDKAGFSDQIEDITVTETLNSRDVRVTAVADTEPMFLHLIGIDEFDAHAASAATQNITNVEIMLVLDVSGSMAGAKIANLRSAASNFVETMLENDPENRISIGVVPYNAQVNLGATLRAKFNATHAHSVANVNCLELPAAAYAAPGIPRTMALPMMARSDHYYGTLTNWGFVAPTDSAYARPNFNANFCRDTPANVVRMPSQDSDQLQAQINALTAGGNTSIMLGMKWGTALLSPEARSIYDEYRAAGLMPDTLQGRPANFNDPQTMKVIVLMTDGEHVAHDRITDAYKSGLSPIWRSTGDGNYSVFHASAPGPNRFWVPHLGLWQAAPWTNNAMVPVQQDWRDIWANLKLSYVAWQFYGRALGVSAYNNAINDMRSIYASVGTMNDQLRTTCTQAKAQGVVVYGIAFEAPANGQAQISNCASSNQHYFVARGSEIEGVFDTIATNLSMLRLTQ